MVLELREFICLHIKLMMARKSFLACFGLHKKEVNKTFAAFFLNVGFLIMCSACAGKSNPVLIDDYTIERREKSSPDSAPEREENNKGRTGNKYKKEEENGKKENGNTQQGSNTSYSRIFFNYRSYRQKRDSKSPSRSPAPAVTINSNNSKNYISPLSLDYYKVKKYIGGELLFKFPYEHDPVVRQRPSDPELVKEIEEDLIKIYCAFGFYPKFFLPCLNENLGENESLEIIKGKIMRWYSRVNPWGREILDTLLWNRTSKLMENYKKEEYAGSVYWFVKVSLIRNEDSAKREYFNYSARVKVVDKFGKLVKECWQEDLYRGEFAGAPMFFIFEDGTFAKGSQRVKRSKGIWENEQRKNEQGLKEEQEREKKHKEEEEQRWEQERKRAGEERKKKKEERNILTWQNLRRKFREGLQKLWKGLNKAGLNAKIMINGLRQRFRRRFWRN